jgi:tetratricopeptide (TPR) repeat protein
MEHNGDGLRDEIAPMVYGMDVDKERKHAELVQFVKEAPTDPLRPATAPHKLEGLDLAELDLMQGNLPAAADLAEAALAGPGADAGRAKYILARIDLMQKRPDDAILGFEAALQLSKDPRTLAWSHIYLGRLYDTEATPERDKAIAEYQAALAARDGRPDTKAAAESGVAHPFQLPQRAQPAPTLQKNDDSDFDPTGKAEKDSYKPDAPH